MMRVVLGGKAAAALCVPRRRRGRRGTPRRRAWSSPWRRIARCRGIPHGRASPSRAVYWASSCPSRTIPSCDSRRCNVGSHRAGIPDARETALHVLPEELTPRPRCTHRRSREAAQRRVRRPAAARERRSFFFRLLLPNYQKSASFFFACVQTNAGIEAIQSHTEIETRTRVSITATEAPRIGTQL